MKLKVSSGGVPKGTYLAKFVSVERGHGRFYCSHRGVDSQDGL